MDGLLNIIMLSQQIINIIKLNIINKDSRSKFEFNKKNQSITKKIVICLATNLSNVSNQMNHLVINVQCFMCKVLLF